MLLNLYLDKIQQVAKMGIPQNSCELLLNLYLWQDSNRRSTLVQVAPSCELLLNLYLWQDSNRARQNGNSIEIVVNCFWIYIFDKIPTGNRSEHWLSICCELLLNLYLWQDSNRTTARQARGGTVVNCFEFISLTRFQQDKGRFSFVLIRCELLLNLYLWQDSNRLVRTKEVPFKVVVLLNLYLWQDSTGNTQ